MPDRHLVDALARALFAEFDRRETRSNHHRPPARFDRLDPGEAAWWQSRATRLITNPTDYPKFEREIAREIHERHERINRG